MDTSAGSLPSSPMDTVPSRILPTPRRKLSMSVCLSGDETTPQRTTSMDSGYGGKSGGSQFSCTSKSSSRGEGSCRPLSELLLNSQDVTAAMCARRRTPSLKKTTLGESEKLVVDKENLSPSSSSEAKFFLGFPPPQRPSSLPAFSSPPPLEWIPTKRNLIKQISSPMGRMSLQSPTNCPPSSSLGSQPSCSSRPSSTASISESDGYFSEVFGVEEVEEPAISAELSSLISTPSGPTPMTSVFADENKVVKPTPVRASSYEDTQKKQASLKRNSPMSNLGVVHCSKRRPLPFTSNSQDSPPSSSAPTTLLRSQSCCMPTSPTLSPGTRDEGYIGDFSKPYALPLVEGSVRDLKCISSKTLCDLMKGTYQDKVDGYTILDCRYPYEYEGGHIRGAKNIWTSEQLLEMLFTEFLRHPEESKREVIVLHCEYSSKRGPKMSRFLRETDRKMNGMEFPKLYYPELYLLEGGYKAFCEVHPEMCDPQGYCSMNDVNHTEELRKYKLRSKSWSQSKQTQNRRRPMQHRHSVASISRH